MNILFVSMLGINLREGGIYSDLIHTLLESGHKVTLVDDQKIMKEEKKHKNLTITPIGISITKMKNRYLKGILSLILEFIVLLTLIIKSKQKSYDLMLYATPPIMYTHMIRFCKKRFHCKTFLMLKDIFPQNAVDEGIIKKESILYQCFRRKERELYFLSDYIGCMSPKNMKYLLDQNPEIPEDKVLLFPNSIKIRRNNRQMKAFHKLRERFGIEKDKIVFVFGGNLGIAQGIPFLSEVIKQFANHPKAYFLIVGTGTHSAYLKELAQNQKNVLYLNRMPKKKFDLLLSICDVGIISLGQMYTIPNYPSRMLSYMEAALPILAITDSVTDVHSLLEQDANCGLWSLAGDIMAASKNVEALCSDATLRKKMGQNGYRYCKKQFDVRQSVEILEALI